MPKNPYTKLLNDIRKFCSKLKHARRTPMFYFSKDTLKPHNSWRLDDVYQRALAAKELGHEVILEADENGLHIKYREQTPVPYLFEN